MLKISIC